MRIPHTRLLMILAALLVTVSARSASAHSAPYSYLEIIFGDGSLNGTLKVHVIDVAQELKIAPPERLLDGTVLGPIRQQITAVLAPRLSLRSNRRLTLSWLAVEPLPEEQALLLRFTIPREEPGSLTIDMDLFPYDPRHQTFITIYEGEDGKEGKKVSKQLIFDASTPPYTYYLGTTQGVVAVMTTFIPSGIHHILIGPDHILFLVGLLLLGGSWIALVRIVTAFTIGHSVTLSLAALNMVTPPPTIIEPAIALSIVFVGADNLVRGNGRDVRAWVALVFGLVHGFGFANVLREFGLPDQALGWSLFSFNVGVEIGQLAIVMLVASLLAAVRRRSATLGYRVAFAGSLVVIAAGTYWFVQRVFFPGA